MSAPRLTAEFWIKAHIRILAVQDIAAFVVRRGDTTAGQVLVKVNRLAPAGDAGVIVLVPTFDPDGERAWRAGTGSLPVTEADADAYLKRQIDFDSDAWILEIEDREGRHMLSPVLAEQGGP